MLLLILEAAARALALAVITGACLWLLRVKNVAVQRSAWAIVLLSAFAMPALMRSPWTPSFLQWRPSFLSAKTEAPAPIVYTPPKVTDLRLTSVHRLDVLPAAEVRPAAKRWHFTPTFFLAVYCAIAGLLTLRILFGLISAITLWRRATPISEPSTHSLRVRISSEVTSPVTIGAGVVLPADYDRWTREKLRAVLAHERAHVSNFDFHLQLLAGFYAALVWFSPLGWWLRRRLAVLGEAMSDQAGIAEVGTRANYAEIVLHFAAMPRRPITGVAMACSGNITRRIEQLLNEDLYQAAFERGRKRAVVAFLVMAFAIFAASMVLRVPAAHAAQVAPPPPQAAPESPSQGSEVSAPEPPPEAPDRPETPQTSIVERTTTTMHSKDSHSYSYGHSDDGQSYALVDGTNTNMTFSGDWNSENPHLEIDKARRMVNGGKFFWFRHDGKSYVVTDPSILAELKSLYAPIEELGRQQEELGKQQEALGRQQEALGRRQEQASVSTPDLTREIDELNAAMKKLEAMKGKETTQEQLAEIQDKLGELQSRVGELQGKIGEKQGSFGEEQGRLGEQQGKLGEQQGRLGEQQGKLAEEANEKVKTVIKETLSNGKAQQVQ